MDEFTPFYKKAGFWRGCIVWGLLVSFLLLFWIDIGPGLRGWWALLFILLGQEMSPFDAGQVPSMVRLALNITVYTVAFLLSVFYVAQFLFPVRTWRERSSAFWRLIFYWTRFYRGPAVFVRNGHMFTRMGEDDNTKPGVVVVDLRSAVVVEQEYPHIEESDYPWEQNANADTERSAETLRIVRQDNQDRKPPVVPRVLTPGVHFTAAGERIRAALDLRPQLRLALGTPLSANNGIEHPEPGVKALTRDAIEVGTNCYVVYSVADAPHVIRVAYWGGTEAKHLRELEYDEEGDTIRLKKTYPLDPSDADEIHEAVAAARVLPISSRPGPANTGQSLFRIDHERVLNAAYGQPVKASPSDPSEWHELPLNIAVNIFRNLLERYRFDYLYSVDDVTSLPWMDELMGEFMRRVRYQGVLSYQLLRPLGTAGIRSASWDTPLDGPPLSVRIGDRVRWDVLELSASYDLTGPKSLRDRGIKILTAGFTELKMHSDIQGKLVERWNARWEREIQIALARQEREAMQIISSARNRAQRDNAYFLSSLFKEDANSTAAMALLLFQALELAATDLRTHKDLPPKDVLAMLQNLHNWLLKERREMKERKQREKKNENPDDKRGIGSS